MSVTTPVNGNAVASTLTGVFGESDSTWHQFGLIMVWLYVLGWSTYGPEAPATFAPEFIDTKNDTRKAIMSTGAFNVFLSALLPLAVVGTLGYSAIAGDLTGIVYMIDVLKAIVGDFFGGVLVVCLCAGLLLSMNTATMDGSRALFGMARDGLTVKQLSVLNSHHVPGARDDARHAHERVPADRSSPASSSCWRRATSATSCRTCLP